LRQPLAVPDGVHRYQQRSPAMQGLKIIAETEDSKSW
jgi:hypothetical protein